MPTTAPARSSGWPGDQSKTDVTRSRVDWLRHASRRTVTTAIVRSAQERTAFNHATRNANLRHRGIVTLLLGDRTDRSTAGFGRVPIRVPVGCPLPHISDHVEKPVGI